MKTVHLIIACRPNIVKIAPLYHALKASGWCTPVIVHTGQHADDNMSGALFRDLGLPAPDFSLNETKFGRTTQRYGELLDNHGHPDAVVVPGDVMGSAACAVVASQRGIPLVHLEAGLRSGDWGMPEERNRVLIDSISDLLWAPSEDAADYLAHHSPRGQLEHVGNIMMDSYEMLRWRIETAAKQYSGRHIVATLHRQSNVDNPHKLAILIDMLNDVSNNVDQVVLVAHPRLRDKMRAAGIWSTSLVICDPMSYIDFQALVSRATAVITDSGGVQEEAAYIGVQCITLRASTERPVTLKSTNTLARPEEVREVLARGCGPRLVLDLWDGQTAQRCVESLRRFLEVYV